MTDTLAPNVEPPRKRVMFLIEWTSHGPTVSHCQPSETLASLASEEMRDRTPPNLPEIAWRQIQQWIYAYAHGEWSRGAHR